jgi:hypothetical protein
MSPDHHRDKVSVRLAGAVALLCAMLVVGPLTAIVHAQEEGASGVTPPAVDDDAGWDSAADPEDATATAADPSSESANSVLELPQVVSVNRDAAAASSPDAMAASSPDPNALADPGAAADPSDSAPADDSAADQPDNGTTDSSNDLAAYAAEGAVANAEAAAANEVPPVSAPVALPGAAIVSASPLASYAFVGPVWTPVPRPVVPHYAAGPILRTSPMLMMPAGSHIMMGGFFHRGR